MTPEMQKIREALEPLTWIAEFFAMAKDFSDRIIYQNRTGELTVNHCHRAAEALALIDGMEPPVTAPEKSALADIVAQPVVQTVGGMDVPSANAASASSPDAAAVASLSPDNGPGYARGYEDCWRKFRGHMESILRDQVPEIVQTAMRMVEPRAYMAGTSPALSPAQREGMRTTAETRKQYAEANYARPGDFLHSLVCDIDHLLAERDAAIASSEADRAAMTRCLETQRKIEAENARLREALKPFAERAKEHDELSHPASRRVSDDAKLFVSLGDLRRARSDLAAEGGDPASPPNINTQTTTERK